MTEQTVRVVHDLVSAISAHDVEKLALCFTEDCFYEDVALGGIMQGREAVKAGYADLFASLPDFKLQIVSLVAAGDWVASEWVMTGTSITGKSFSTRGATIDELRGGQVKRNTDYYDPASLKEASA